MVTLIYIQIDDSYENSRRFYQFIHCHLLSYFNKIRVETKRGILLHDKITVEDYLKTIPE